MRLHKSTKQLYGYAYAMYIKLLYAYFISNEHLHMCIISLKVILCVSQGI